MLSSGIKEIKICVFIVAFLKCCFFVIRLRNECLFDIIEYHNFVLGKIKAPGIFTLVGFRNIIFLIMLDDFPDERHGPLRHL